jgi:hypothetical protein
MAAQQILVDTGCTRDVEAVSDLGQDGKIGDSQGEEGREA